MSTPSYELQSPGSKTQNQMSVVFPIVLIVLGGLLASGRTEILIAGIPGEFTLRFLPGLLIVCGCFLIFRESSTAPRQRSASPKPDRMAIIKPAPVTEREPER